MAAVASAIRSVAKSMTGIGTHSAYCYGESELECGENADLRQKVSKAHASVRSNFDAIVKTRYNKYEKS